MDIETIDIEQLRGRGRPKKCSTNQTGQTGHANYEPVNVFKRVLKPLNLLSWSNSEETIYWMPESEESVKNICIPQRAPETIDLPEREESTKNKMYVPQRAPKRNYRAIAEARKKEDKLLPRVLYQLISEIPEPPQLLGRPRISYQDMLMACALKIHHGKTCQGVEEVLEDAYDKGFIDNIPSAMTISEYMNKPKFTNMLYALLKSTADFLYDFETDKSFSMDSTGMSQQSKFSSWADYKFKVRKKKFWYNVHIITGNRTHAVFGAEIKPNYKASDVKDLPELTDKTFENFQMEILCADGLYPSDNNFDYLKKKGIDAYIKFKKNTKPTGRSNAFVEKYYSYMLDPEIYDKKLHNRVQIETSNSMYKRRYGDSVKSKNLASGENEILLILICNNIRIFIYKMFESGYEFEENEKE